MEMITSNQFFKKSFLQQQLFSKDNEELLTPWNSSGNTNLTKYYTINHSIQIKAHPRYQPLLISPVSPSKKQYFSSTKVKDNVNAKITPLPEIKKVDYILQTNKISAKINKSTEFPKLDIKQFFKMRKSQQHNQQSMMVKRNHRKRYMNQFNNSRSTRISRFGKHLQTINRQQTNSILIKKPHFGVIGLPTTKINSILNS